MVIKYSKLSTSELLDHDLVKRAKAHLPVRFLRQQMILVAIVLASFVLYILTPLFTTDIEYRRSQDSSPDSNYAVIVDCGSSGSRAHIFRWRQDPLANPVELLKDQSSDRPLEKHIRPGLSTFKDDPDRASDYMEPIMDFIYENVPSDKHYDTPIYFLATAGMRLLEPSTQKKILNDITKDLRVKYDFPKMKSQVISGSLEGMYSWLSLNINRKIYKADSRSPSYGMIEMGGASTQVTFELNSEVEDAILKKLPNEVAIAAFKGGQGILSLGPREPVKLFATTFLGLGANSAREAYVDLLVHEYANGSGGMNSSDQGSSEVTLRDPCLTQGSREEMFRPKVSQDSTQHHNQSIGFVTREKDETFKVHLEGSGDFLSCKSLLDRVLDLAKREKLNCLPDQPCPMALLETDFIPYRHYPFIGLSEMYFTTNEMLDAAGPFNRSKILHEVKKICDTSYNELVEKYSNSGITQEDRILYECFKASWLLALLHKGLGMPSDYADFSTVSNLEGREVDWTMGAIMSEVALKPLDKIK